MDLAIYGAQGLALGAYQAICDLLPLRTIRCFLVTKQDINAKILSGIPVFELKVFADMLSDREKTEIEVLIATPEDVMPEIEKCLDECGLRCYVRLTSLHWAELMGYHGVREKRFMPLSVVPIGYHKADLYVLWRSPIKTRRCQINITYLNGLHLYRLEHLCMVNQLMVFQMMWGVISHIKMVIIQNSPLCIGYGKTALARSQQMKKDSIMAYAIIGEY